MIGRILERIKEFRRIEPVRFDAYLQRGVTAVAALAGVALGEELAGFVAAFLVHVIWGATMTEKVRSKVTPVAKKSPQ